MVYGAYHLKDDVSKLIRSLSDNFAAGELEIDALQFEGPVFSGVDHRLVGLDLLRRGLATSLLYDPKGKIVPAYEETWGKPMLAYLAPPQGQDISLAPLMERLAAESAGDKNKIIPMEVVAVDRFNNAGGFDEAGYIHYATKPGYVLMVQDMDADALARYALTLNTGFTAVAKAGADAEPEGPLPDSGGFRKAPVKIYRYDAIRAP